MDDVQTMWVFAETVTYSCTFDLQLYLLELRFLSIPNWLAGWLLIATLVPGEHNIINKIKAMLMVPCTSVTLTLIGPVQEMT